MGRANPELYKIINARYVYSSEPTEGSTIKEGPMKQLTSGIEEMTAREPFGQLRTFIPQANTIIQLNIPMGMTATDHGSWRRIRRILFESMFLHKLSDDPNIPFQFLISEGLSGKFEKWAPALAAIAIERAKITNSRIRIELCPEVVAASAAYRKDQDMVAAFMAERLIREPGGSVKKSELMNEFNIWCTQNGDRNLPSKKSKELNSRMDQQYGKQNASGHWGGVNIISEHANYHLDTDEDLSTQP
jgi:phage/plasmid-associated DNA primase